MHFSINMYVPIPLSSSMSQQDANTKKVLFLPFAKSKMIKVYIWRNTVVAISRSDWSSSKKRNIYHTDIACFLVPFQPSWSLVRSKLPQSLCVCLSLRLSTTHTKFLCLSTLSFLFCDVFGHTEIHYFIYTLRYTFTRCFLCMLKKSFEDTFLMNIFWRA